MLCPMFCIDCFEVVIEGKLIQLEKMAFDIGSASQFSLSEKAIIWQVCVLLSGGWCSCAHLAQGGLILQLVAGQ